MKSNAGTGAAVAAVTSAPSACSAPGDASGVTAERMRLRAALAAVPAGQRAAVVLRHYLGLSLEDTAGVLGCTVGTAKSQAARGLARLRELLAVDGIYLTGETIEEWTNALA